MSEFPTRQWTESTPRAPGAEERTALITRLFHEHNESLIRYLALRLRSQQEAREVAQEAYVRLLSLDRPGAVSYLRAFLFKTATNIAVDRIRHDRTVREVAQTGKLLDELESTPSPEQATASAQELRLAERLIDELPPKCRRAFLLHKVYGMDFSKIAQQMGLKERMVRNYVVRAVVYCKSGLDAARAVDGGASHE